MAPFSGKEKWNPISQTNSGRLRDSPHSDMGSKTHHKGISQLHGTHNTTGNRLPIDIHSYALNYFNWFHSLYLTITTLLDANSQQGFVSHSQDSQSALDKILFLNFHTILISNDTPRFPARIRCQQLLTSRSLYKSFFTKETQTRNKRSTSLQYWVINSHSSHTRAQLFEFQLAYITPKVVGKVMSVQHSLEHYLLQLLWRVGWCRWLQG